MKFKVVLGLVVTLVLASMLTVAGVVPAVQYAIYTGVDAFTEHERMLGWTDHIGLGLNATAEPYSMNENVKLYALVVYKGDPRQSVLVVWTVIDEQNQPLLTRTTHTNATGIATINFTTYLENWAVFVKVSIATEPYMDWLWFNFKSAAVGGIIVPVNKLELLMPPIGVISVILVTMTVIVKKRTKQSKN